MQQEQIKHCMQCKKTQNDNVKLQQTIMDGQYVCSDCTGGNVDVSLMEGIMMKQQKQKCTQCKKVQDNLQETCLENQLICQNCKKLQQLRILQFKMARKVTYPQIQQIKNGIYLGNQDAAINKQIIDKYQIKSILVCGNHLMTPFQNEQNLIKYKKFDIPDFPSTRILQLFQQSNKWINQNLKRGNLLVHCAAGVSRSASFVIAYLMNQGLKYQQAFNFVKKCRPVICPNSGFIKQLNQYQKILQLKSN